MIAAILSVSLQARLACAVDSRNPLPPKILVLRGAFEVFSLGMHDLSSKLSCLGYETKVTSWSLALLETEGSDDQPIVIIGHSMGGRACSWLASKFQGSGKRVPLMIIMDAQLIQEIPTNVDRCVNLYTTNPFGVFQGSPVRGKSPATEIINRNVSLGQPSFIEGGVNHVTIDATEWVHRIIIDEVTGTFPAPATFDGQSQPVRVPRGNREAGEFLAKARDRGGRTTHFVARAEVTNVYVEFASSEMASISDAGDEETRPARP